ncbi:MAG: EVE domain-containing protein [Chthoniobacterales bacterium]|nr:EVE domain-containing protein [Chthoniobacterales bacterium]
MKNKLTTANCEPPTVLSSDKTIYWLVKQEPTAYSWTTFVKDGETEWTGVRNFQARNNLRSMKKGDQVLFYHSVLNPSVVGVAEVTKTAYPDPTAPEGDWSCVVLKPGHPLKRPVTLAEIKAIPELAEMALIKQSRLSVMPVTEKEFKILLHHGEQDSPPLPRSTKGTPKSNKAPKK